MTRLTYTLDGMTGSFKVGSDGSVAVQERTTWTTPPSPSSFPAASACPSSSPSRSSPARVTPPSSAVTFVVLSYRGSSFLDPKGRGGSTGYDNAVALPAKSDADELLKENNKNVAALKGSAVFNVAKYDEVTGEIAGVFESIQPSDTDLGSKAPKDIKITGLWCRPAREVSAPTVTDVETNLL